MEPEMTTCECGLSWGFYKCDGWNAVILGKGLAIGLDNNAVAFAKKERAGGSPKSVWLSAWLMAADHDTIEYGSKRDDPVSVRRDG